MGSYGCHLRPRANYLHRACPSPCPQNEMDTGVCEDRLAQLIHLHAHTSGDDADICGDIGESSSQAAFVSLSTLLTSISVPIGGENLVP